MALLHYNNIILIRYTFIIMTLYFTRFLHGNIHPQASMLTMASATTAAIIAAYSAWTRHVMTRASTRRTTSAFGPGRSVPVAFVLTNHNLQPFTTTSRRSKWLQTKTFKELSL